LSERTTYLLVDGETIDATLGGEVPTTDPNPEERPWERVREFARQDRDQPVTALFFLNATSGQLAMTFVQALLALSYRPVPLAGALGPAVGTGGERLPHFGASRQQRRTDRMKPRPRRRSTRWPPSAAAGVSTPPGPRRSSWARLSAVSANMIAVAP
jgi:hypothetical protein